MEPVRSWNFWRGNLLLFFLFRELLLRRAYLEHYGSGRLVRRIPSTHPHIQRLRNRFTCLDCPGFVADIESELTLDHVDINRAWPPFTDASCMLQNARPSCANETAASSSRFMSSRNRSRVAVPGVRRGVNRSWMAPPDPGHPSCRARRPVAVLPAIRAKPPA